MCSSKTWSYVSIWFPYLHVNYKLSFITACCIFWKQPFSRHCPISVLPENVRNQRFSNIFSGYRNGTMAWKGWINIHCSDYYELASYFEQKINFSLKCNFSPLNLQKSCLFRCRSLYTTWSNNYKKTLCKKKKK